MKENSTPDTQRSQQEQNNDTSSISDRNDTSTDLVSLDEVGSPDQNVVDGVTQSTANSDQPATYIEDELQAVEAEPPTNGDSTTTRPLDDDQDQDLATAPAVAQDQLANTQPTKRRLSKGLIAGIVAAVILVLLGIGTVVAYAWYQQPDKVITDALVNSINARTVTHVSTINFTTNNTTNSSDKMELKVSLDGMASRSDHTHRADISMTSQGKTMKYSAEYVQDNQYNFYIKFKGIKEIIMSMFAGQEIPESINNFIATVDNQWVKISQDDIKTWSPEAAKQYSCMTDVLKEVKNNNSYYQEIGSIYANNRFIVSKKELGAKGPHLGYVVNVEGKKVKSFIADFRQTKLGKKVQRCAPDLLPEASDYEGSEDSGGADEEGKVELWVDRWSHNVAEIKVSDKSADYTLDASLKPVFNKNVAVKVPDEFMSLSELKQEIDKIQQEFNSYSSLRYEAKSTAITIEKNAEAYNAVTGGYPSYEELTAEKSKVPEAQLDSDVRNSVTSLYPTEKTPERVQYEPCKSGDRVTGANIRHYDRSLGKIETQSVGVCTVATNT